MKITDRVFCVGLNKTGTTSIKRCFTVLGIQPIAPSAKHDWRVLRAVFDRNDYGPALRLAEKYRAFEDRPWNVWQMYRKLDERFPGSRFILTKRDPERWWGSVERWLSYTKPRMATVYRQHLAAKNLLMGSMIEAYERYNCEVTEYFSGRDDLLVMELEKEQGWERICRFLGRAVPPVEFPHANRQYYDERDLKKDRVKRHRNTSPSKTGTSTPPCLYCGETATTHLKPPRRWMPQVLHARIRSNHIKTVERDARRLRAGPERIELLRRQWPNLRLDDMAVVCSFFNPGEDAGALERYYQFRQAIERSHLPLLTVELAIGLQPYQLGTPNANLLQVRSADAMWHRERLLNLGIEELLRRGFRKIVWLDSNIVFEDSESWPWAVAAGLEQSAVCQVFSHVLIHRHRGEPVAAGIGAVKYFEETQEYVNQTALRPSARWPAGRPPGYAGFGWAANADVLRKVLPYDRAIAGGGDRMLFAAGHGYSDAWFRSITKQLTHYRFPRCGACRHRIAAPEYTWHYATWAQRWAAAVENGVGYVEQIVRDFSGVASPGDPTEIASVLLRHRYDPERDIKSNELGCLEWASERPSLQRDVAHYIMASEQRATG